MEPAWVHICLTPGLVLFHWLYYLAYSQISETSHLLGILRTDQEPRKSNVWEPINFKKLSGRELLPVRKNVMSNHVSDQERSVVEWSPLRYMCWRSPPFGGQWHYIQVSSTNMSKKWILPASEFIYTHLTSKDLDRGSWFHCLEGKGGKKFCKSTFLVRLPLLHKCISQNCCKSISVANNRK